MEDEEEEEEEEADEGDSEVEGDTLRFPRCLRCCFLDLVVLLVNEEDEEEEVAVEEDEEEEEDRDREEATSDNFFSCTFVLTYPQQNIHVVKELRALLPTRLLVARSLIIISQ